MKTTCASKQASKSLIALALMLCSGYACSSTDNNGDDNEPYKTDQAKEEATPLTADADSLSVGIYHEFRQSVHFSSSDWKVGKVTMKFKGEDARVVDLNLKPDFAGMEVDGYLCLSGRDNVLELCTSCNYTSDRRTYEIEILPTTSASEAVTITVNQREFWEGAPYRRWEWSTDSVEIPAAGDTFSFKSNLRDAIDIMCSPKSRAYDGEPDENMWVSRVQLDDVNYFNFATDATSIARDWLSVDAIDNATQTVTMTIAPNTTGQPRHFELEFETYDRFKRFSGTQLAQ
jgi:hypothetical protein